MCLFHIFIKRSNTFSTVTTSCQKSLQGLGATPELLNSKPSNGINDAMFTQTALPRRLGQCCQPLCLENTLLNAFLMPNNNKNVEFSTIPFVMKSVVQHAKHAIVCANLLYNTAHF